MIPYVIRPGDHLARLAHERGFDAAEVWSHAANAAIRERRRNPQILAPGDVIYVPATPADAGRRLRSGATHAFAGAPPTGTLKLRFAQGDHVLANEPYRVEGIPGTPTEGTTDADGTLTAEIPVHVETVVILFTSSGMRYSVRIGQLDPIEESSGVRSRLRHLGYLGAFGLEPRPREVQRAIRGFQRDRGLPATGDVDDATRAALLEAHHGV